jgi:hypothetical protein
MYCTLCKQEKDDAVVVAGMCTSCLSVISNFAEAKPRTAKAPPTTPVPEHTFYRVRMGDFETVVDSRDVEHVYNLFTLAIDKHQPWYFSSIHRDEYEVESMNHNQYCDWLRR